MRLRGRLPWASGIFLFAALALAGLAVQAQSITVLNLASGSPWLAPESAGEIRGVEIEENAQAQIGRGGVSGLPLELAGYSVEVGGAACGMWAVSPERIVFVVPRLSLRQSFGWQEVVVRAPGRIYQGGVTIQPVAPGIFRANPDDLGVLWPLGLYRVGDGMPQIIGEQAIPVGRPGVETVVSLVATGLKHATTITVWVDGQAIPLAQRGRFVFPWEEMVAFGLPERLPDGLVEVAIVADGQMSNPVWLRLGHRDDN